MQFLFTECQTKKQIKMSRLNQYKLKIEFLEEDETVLIDRVDVSPAPDHETCNWKVFNGHGYLYFKTKKSVKKHFSGDHVKVTEV